MPCRSVRLCMRCCTHMRFSNSEKSLLQQPKSVLINFANTKRASIEDFDMAAKRRRNTRRRVYGKKRQSNSGARGVRLVKGKVKIKLGKSAKSLVTVAPSALIRHIPLTKLKSAARKVVGNSVQAKRQRRGGRRGRKRRATGPRRSVF